MNPVYDASTGALEVTTESVIWDDNFIWDDRLIWRDTIEPSPTGVTLGFEDGAGIYVTPSFPLGLAIYRLLPSGQAWPPEEEDSDLRKLIFGIARTAEAFLIDLDDIMKQYYPGNIGIFLEDWEEVLGLTSIVIELQLTYEARVNVVKAMFNVSEYSTGEFLEVIAAIFGYDITVTHDPVTDPFEIVITMNDVDDPVYRTGRSRAGDRLGESGASDLLESILERFRQEHTYFVFIT